ncbi:hypothetical protein BATDEDRAFT_22093 [Batrachochytrium dendrobatidis JAM81]|uniref:SET domain-containing protein n=1 Tax=Batrachochytrium dendrobatidis (strain JAM81 / FGSC 10211) TaxID=684364 RepID=F4NSD3_BATDJ|nr:uncharacterized protein BATDEDRAFT_22093 [Batrachochytrium dendrobatidis JAM81]EGF83413.1 hypothetical protein BATDEDRAFT_22093 [Batrachochytrium dendrobatidis JAM81]KAJ8326902.1 hypothetical protein O5D80_004331 [Batrachochytrium dendrobatidis]KAK5668300.1 hypothetical protein QVD99_005333 [Batrachochytrium dendrobatidis]|eukprot:XP_006675468.1 hypothetical protein BATDEDRAFT_22093 [Batrachochytrium dendrobatidis JAM81]
MDTHNYSIDKTLPVDWPEDVTFLKHNRLASEIPEHIQTLYGLVNHPTCPTLLPQPKTPIPSLLETMDELEIQSPIVCDTVSIQKIANSSHPAHGEYGLFAVKDVPPHAYILDYRGTIQLDDLIDHNSDYCIHFHGTLSIDAAVAGNEARFINDFRRVNERPNVAFDVYRDRLTGECRVGVFTLNQIIQAGQELLVTYGKSFWKSRNVVSNEPNWDPSWDD